jgi:hypothetical protein
MTCQAPYGGSYAGGSGGHDHRMARTPSTSTDLRRIGGGSAFGAAVAVATGSTPIGVIVVAGLGGALSWRLRRGESRER